MNTDKPAAKHENPIACNLLSVSGQVMIKGWWSIPRTWTPCQGWVFDDSFVLQCDCHKASSRLAILQQPYFAIDCFLTALRDALSFSPQTDLSQGEGHGREKLLLLPQAHCQRSMFQGSAMPCQLACRLVAGYGHVSIPSQTAPPGAMQDACVMLSSCIDRCPPIADCRWVKGSTNWMVHLHNQAGMMIAEKMIGRATRIVAIVMKVTDIQMML